jgi:hypothetical protein
MFVPQPHLQDNQGKLLSVMTPSLYGIVSNLTHLFHFYEQMLTKNHCFRALENLNRMIPVYYK